MGGKADSPDYEGLAQQAGELSEGVTRDQTYANRANTVTPFGYESWQANPFTDPGSGEQTTQWERTIGLDPASQEQLNKDRAIRGGMTDIAGGLTDRLAGEYGQGLDYTTGVGQAPAAQYTLPESFENAPGIGDPDAIRGRAEDAWYGKAQSRLAPQFESKRNAMEIKLRNQGIGPEDEAWKSQMGMLDQQETDAYGQANYDAIRAGLGEAESRFGQDVTRRGVSTGEAKDQYGMALGSNAQNFGMGVTAADLANRIRGEERSSRGYGLNEIKSIIEGGQVGIPQIPGYNPAAAATPAPVYQAGVDQGNFDQASNPWSGIAGLTGTLGGAALGNTSLFGG